ncbi:endonuclease domain-containing protein [Marinoscillum pacificum]|uniref:endonuclease domain-containing protein n=1 Tax=Marinoscillum pacificum TaxID=392723 RepID=UPI002158548A|nr:endonuclease domain-containing protein [Marinoscillum pacificum]
MRRKIIPYNPKLKELARQLRNNITKSEIRLWRYLKGKQMMGYDFHRQKPLLNFIADFFCHELKLVIELDGYTHQFEEVIAKDKIKQDELESLGLTVLRFTDEDVMKDINNVLRTIEIYIEEFEKQ